MTQVADLKDALSDVVVAAVRMYSESNIVALEHAARIDALVTRLHAVEARLPEPADHARFLAMAMGTWIPPIKRLPEDSTYEQLLAHHNAETKILLEVIADMAKRLRAIKAAMGMP